ncbi:MAG: D-alanyl-D-alanine carboxypeptidase family protein [Gaiellaceae bacterium]
MFAFKRLIAVAGAAVTLAAPAHAAVPRVNARAFFVVDGTTGDVLAQHAANTRLPVASITKLMTVLVTLEHARLSDVVTIRRQAAEVGESTINLRPGERITVRELLAGALIQSANDAADALADYVGHGNDAVFVTMMNADAKRLGLSGTHFVRPDGLDAPGHVSTARDVTRLAQELMKRPVVRALVRERSATIAGGRTLHTWNDLLGVFRGLVGVKTGHTGGAGWCQVAEVKRDGLDVYATVLGSPTRGERNADLAALLRWAFAVERPAWVIAPGRVYVRVTAGYGRAAIPLVAAQPLLRAVRVDRPLVEHVLAPVAVKLPVHRGDRLGEVRVFSGRTLVARRPLVAARSVSRPGLFGRLGFYGGRTFSHIGAWLR